MRNLKNKKIVLGICGSIAAYKAPELIRKLMKLGALVSCVLTKNGARFVTPLTLQTLSGGKVYEDMFDPYDCDIEHISLSKAADMILIAPATADIIARLACGRADDLLSSLVLSTRKPVLICPAMNDKMWLHEATKDNVRRLKKFGYGFVEPARGGLACGDTAIGRLADIETIVKAAAGAVR